jgi:hypothetical protein
VADAMIKAMFALAQRRPGMLARVVTGQYCSVHQLLFLCTLQEWLSFSPVQIAHAFGDTMQVVGSSLSPVSGAGTERHAQAISGAVCRVLWSWNNWGMILLRPQWLCAGRIATAACGG